ncbi:hypothetical protein [Streptomyces sp. NPDC087859]|uniref:hypothetical protein n=1 Tax=Streptomyces sp. NPDC087859 TaxID=3365812 RepID=UPI003814E4CA
MDGLRTIKRRERHAAAHALYDKGVQSEVIAKTLGLDRKTVRRYAHAATPEDASSREPSPRTEGVLRPRVVGVREVFRVPALLRRVEMLVRSYRCA